VTDPYIPTYKNGFVIGDKKKEKKKKQCFYYYGKIDFVEIC
jgi:hypothetical protein